MQWLMIRSAFWNLFIITRPQERTNLPELASKRSRVDNLQWFGLLIDFLEHEGRIRLSIASSSISSWLYIWTGSLTFYCFLPEGPVVTDDRNHISRQGKSLYLRVFRWRLCRHLEGQKVLIFFQLNHKWSPFLGGDQSIWLFFVDQDYGHTHLLLYVEVASRRRWLPDVRSIMVIQLNILR